MSKKDERFSREKLGAAVGQIFTVDGKQYKVEGVVGDGAIGIVRKAKNIKTKKQVAIKFLAPEFRYIERASIDDIHARFRREGERGVELDHNNLVDIISYQENEDSSSFINNKGPHSPFLVMEFVRGITLEQYIHRQRKPRTYHVTHQTVYIANEICKALLYLHDHKLIHRDVKPANIYLSKAEADVMPRIVKLGDFGVVKWGDFKASMTTGTLTMTGHAALGTFKYMSPEQAVRPRDVSVRADMYSFGITLFELFTNQILPSPHHVFAVTQARLKRGTVASKMLELGFPVPPSVFEGLFSHILDMFLTGPLGRPSSRQMQGRLEYLVEAFDSV